MIAWREKWAETVNQYLAQYPWINTRIDHRSNAARGLDEQSTVHEGYHARKLESMGIVSDRCELNRQIKADNRLLQELRAQIKKLADTVKIPFRLWLKLWKISANELMDARLTLRTEKEAEAAERLRAIYGEKFDSELLRTSRQEISDLLGDKLPIRSLKERLHPKQQEQMTTKQKRKQRDPER